MVKEAPLPQLRVVEHPPRPNLLSKTSFLESYQQGSNLIQHALDSNVSTTSIGRFVSVGGDIDKALTAQEKGGSYVYPNPTAGGNKDITVTGSFDVNTGKWSVDTGFGLVKEGFIDHIEPTRIHALEEIAATDNAAITAEQRAQAKKTAGELRASLEVTTGSGDTAKTESYEDWWKRVETKALEAAATTGKPTDYKPTRDELLTAENDLIKSEGARFGFVCTADKPDPAEAKSPKEKAETAVEKKAHDIIHDVTAGLADGKTKEQINAIQADPEITVLMQAYDALTRTDGKKPIDAKHRSYLLGIIHSHLSLLAESSNPGITDSIRGDLRAFVNDPVIGTEMKKARQAFATDVIGPILKQVDPDWQRTLANLENDPGVLTDLLLALRLKKQVGEDNFTKALSQITADTGNEFSSQERTLIGGLVRNPEALNILEGSFSNMGLDFDLLENPQRWAATRAQTLVMSTAKDGERPDKTDVAAEKTSRQAIIDQRITVVKKLADIKMKKQTVMEFKKAGKKIGIGFGAMALVLTMFQNTLSFGLIGSKEEEGQGH